MSQHTHRPWEYRKDTEDCHVVAVNGNSTWPVALICQGLDDDPEWAAEVEANARLIAAAPDLLDVCKRVLANLRKHTDGTARIDAAYLDDIRNVIAKAEGQ